MTTDLSISGTTMTGREFRYVDPTVVQEFLLSAWCSGPVINVFDPIVQWYMEDGGTHILDQLVHSSYPNSAIDSGDKVLAIILSHAPDLETLLVRLSPSLDSARREALCIQLHLNNLRPFVAWRPRPIESSMFRHLTCLTIKPDSFSIPLKTRMLTPITQLPRLRRLEIHEDDGEWPSLATGEWAVGALPNLEELYLYQSQIHETELARLLLLCSNLKVLLVHFSAWFIRERADPETTLNESLATLRKSLVSLTLQRRSPGHFIASNPPRLNALHLLRKLSHLAIDFKGLLGPFSDRFSQEITTLLPKALVSLDVIADWSDQLHTDNFHGYNSYWERVRLRAYEIAELATDKFHFPQIDDVTIRLPSHQLSRLWVTDYPEVIWLPEDDDWFEGWETR
jgi:hypothetical protein